MALKSVLKKMVKEGDMIRVDHMNGKEYSGKILDMDATNPSDFTLVLEDNSGDKFVMNIGAGMGVVMVPADDEASGEASDEDEDDEEPVVLKHEPPVKSEIEKVPVEPEKKKTGKNFKDVHKPVSRTVQRR